MAILARLFEQHDLRLVVLAALVCALSAFAGIGLLHRARGLNTRSKLIWISIAAVAVGFGVWSTHFIAMLAYRPGFTLGFDPFGTTLSLLIAIVVTGVGFSLASFGTRTSDHLLGGCVVGLGIVGMHYAGMGALQLGGVIDWNGGLITLSVTFAAGLAAAALMIGAVRTSTGARALSISLLTLSIVALHFTGMGAADLSNCFGIADANGADTAGLAAGVTLGSGIIFALTFLALFLDGRDKQRRALEAMRLHSLADAAVEGLVIVADNAIVGVNKSFADLYGHEREALTGQQLAVLFDMETIQLARGLPDQFWQTQMKAADGSTIAVELVSRRVTLSGGASEVIAVRDIRQRLKQEAEHERAHQAAVQSERRFRLLIQSVTDYAIYTLDPEGHVADWNAGAQRNKGYTADEIVGQHFSKFFGDADRLAGLPQDMLATARSKGKVQNEGWRYRKDGSRFWAMVILEAIYEDDGRLIGFAKITRDVTRQHEDAERIAIARRNLELSLTHMSQGLALFDANERIVVANKRLKEILGIPVNISIDGLSLIDLAKFLNAEDESTPEQIDAIYAVHKRLIAGEEHGEIVQEFAGGRSIRIVHRMAEDGAWVSTFEDISERKRSEAQIHYMAHHDGLTGLPNRNSFSRHLDAELAQAGPGVRVAVLGIDLDRFKEVNDQLGHAVGDAVLKDYAARIGDHLQDQEFIARFGGDEFAAFKVFRQDAELFAFIERVEHAVADKFAIDKNEVYIGSSIGVAIFPDDGLTGEKLISNADMAMYRAKENLAERVCYYEPEMDEAARDRRLLARELWDAPTRHQLTVRYQVQKSVQSGLVTGYEALVRWRHPERGLISPADFIPIAEECGAILPIGEWVLRTACEEAINWAPDIKLAVNISPVQLGASGNLVQVVQKALADTGLPPHRLELEVTESAIISDKSRALQTLQEIKALGVTIAIDDFGTGYSSIETLRSFPFDKIKLDRSFMQEVETSKQAKAVVRAILAMGKGLDVPVLAEGVENDAQLAFLAAEGCDEAQGYLLGRPESLSSELKQKAG